MVATAQGFWTWIVRIITVELVIVITARHEQRQEGMIQFMGECLGTKTKCAKTR
ncbi:MAG: hypothetical protein L0Y39_12275 [Methylococcaceae bacterium]|nr:hypothetical protein [Methylococcaceae bacterium]